MDRQGRVSKQEESGGNEDRGTQKNLGSEAEEVAERTRKAQKGIGRKG